MLVRLLLLSLLVLPEAGLYAQKQANRWYFGNKIGLNFNQSPPQTLFDGGLTSIEGCATISDANGDLLFYTNGIEIKNKEHKTMFNGTGIMGDLSSTNNTVIVPVPGRDSIFYLFSVGSAGQTDKGLRYSIIDVKRQNGLGEVILKNGLLQDNCFEKLAAVRHCNNKDVWITVKQWGTDSYLTFLLTQSGINDTPVMSSLGNIIGGESLNSLGTLKFSSDGKKLVALHSFGNDVAELMRFDNRTGILSDPVIFRANTDAPSLNYFGMYGAAFSPDNSLLYISCRNGAAAKSVLYQFDISVHDAFAITGSKYLVGANNNWDAGALQTGPDRKIYFSEWNKNSLSVINNPDNAGAACNYAYASISFAPTTQSVQFGLPNFIASDIDTNYAPFNFSWTKPDCNSLRLNFAPNRLTGIDSVKWIMEDGFTSEDLTPTHLFLQPGIYTVTLTVFKTDCGEPFETITHKVNVGSAGTFTDFLPKDTTICAVVDIILGADVSSDTYLWNTGATTPQINVLAPGIYWLDISKDGCLFRDSIVIDQKPPMEVQLGVDKAVCVNKPVLLTAVTNQPASYTWSTGSTASSIEVNMAGDYWVEASVAGGCKASDTLRAYWGECAIYIPTAFSPNGDGINETFGLINGISSTVFTFYIFNRYGQLVFTTNDALKKWDGKFKGKPCTTGMYIWTMTYKNKEGLMQTDKGTVMLIH